MVDKIRYACVPVETGHTMETSFWTNLAVRLCWRQGKHIALGFRVLWTILGRKHETWMVPFWISFQAFFKTSFVLITCWSIFVTTWWMRYKTHWQTLYIGWSIQCENNHSMTRCLYRSHIHLSYYVWKSLLVPCIKSPLHMETDTVIAFVPAGCSLQNQGFCFIFSSLLW